jgi:hypothetical protein
MVAICPRNKSRAPTTSREEIFYRSPREIAIFFVMPRLGSSLRRFLGRCSFVISWHQKTGYLLITRAGFDLTRKQGFYIRNPGAGIAIAQITQKPPTANSRSLRLGSFVLIRWVIEDELEAAFLGKLTAKEALDSAVKC